MAFLFSTLFALLTSISPAAEKTLIILGDSLTEGYGVTKEKSFPSLLQEKLNAEGKQKWKIVNAGVSGSTTASGPGRVKWILKTKPDVIIVALGANDGLRGTPVETTEKNLAQVIEEIQKEKIQVMLVGMQMPPNYGPGFTKSFAELFPRLAKKYKIHLIPFMLAKVAGVASLNQADGIHPNEKGHVIVAQTFYDSLKGVLK